MSAIQQRPSPNHGSRPATAKIDCIILHADAGKSEQGTIAWVQDPQSKISYHYLIGRAGTVYQFVQDVRRAWHAGPSVFEGKEDCNDYSLGVSFANDQKGEPFTDEQIEAGVHLVADLCAQHGIPISRITTHSAVCVPPGRKTDPGIKFPLGGLLARVEAALG